jgi:hypothetical protein
MFLLRELSLGWLIILLLEAIWLFLLFFSPLKNSKKIIILAFSFLTQFIGIYIIFQGGIEADEQGTQGNIFGNPFALIL